MDFISKAVVAFVSIPIFQIIIRVDWVEEWRQGSLFIVEIT